MSAKLMGQIWDLALPHNQAWVLMALADHADHDGNNVYPGLELLSHKTGYSERQLRRVLSELEEEGIIIQVTGGIGRGQRQCYRINLKAAPVKPEKRTSCPQIAAAKSGQFDTEKADKMSGNQDQKADILTTKSGHPDTEKRTFSTGKADISGFSYKEEPSIEPSIEPSEREESALSGILPILLEAYRNIAKDRVPQEQLSWQVQQLEGDGATVEEVKAWLKSRRSLSSIRFIAEDFRTWKESQRFARQIKNADALVGLNQEPPVVIASISPVEDRPARKGAYGQVLEILAESLPEAAILTWFEPLAESRVDDGILHLTAPHESFRPWIENNYADEFYAAIERAGLGGAVIGEENAEAEERTEAA